MTNLANKHAVISGAGSGIGAAIAEALDKHGVRITAMGRRLEALQSQVKKLRDAQAIKCDLTQSEQVHAAFDKATEQFGTVDIMINNAGQVISNAFVNMDQQQWQTMLDCNLNSVFTCSKLTYPAMCNAGWGRIINIASTAALKGYAYVSGYCAAKHAVVGLTRALALEAAQTGVTVNAICPGYTDTDIITRAVDTISAKTGCSPTQALDQLTKANPQRRLIQPTEVANTVVWLCSEESQSITGQSIAIAGGEVM